MINRNYIKLDKISLARWVDKALDQALSRKNKISRFKNTRIWLLDPKAMNERIRPSSLYTIVNQIREDQDDDYQSNQEEDGEMEWAKQNVVEKLINITSTAEPTTHEFMLNNVAQNQPRYYVDMPTLSRIINLELVSLTKKLVETLEQSSTNVGEECRILEIQEALVGSNLLSLPHLLTRRISGRE
jgi:hypothetical protein